MLKRLIVVLATIASTACVTVVPPQPVMGPGGPLPRPQEQRVNQIARRVDATVINNCAAPILLVTDNNNRVVALLRPGGRVLVYVQRSFNNLEPSGTVKVYGYLRDDLSSYIGESEQTYYYNLGTQNSYVVPKETWRVDNLTTHRYDTWNTCGLDSLAK